MSDSEQVAPLRPDKNQRTLFSLAKVVRLENTSRCFTLEDIGILKTALLDMTQTKQELLTILRKLDCYNLNVDDLVKTDIGPAVATLARLHPKADVSRLAGSVLQKWRAMAEHSLFRSLEFDAAAARSAPDGEAVAPAVLIAAEKEQARLEKLERRRQRIEEDFMAVSSSDDEKDENDGFTDPEWAPTGGAPAAPTAPSHGQGMGPSRQQSAAALANYRRSRSARAAALAAKKEAQERVVLPEEEAMEIEGGEGAGAVVVSADVEENEEAVTKEEEVGPEAPKPKKRPTVLMMLQNAHVQKALQQQSQQQSQQQQQQQ